LPVSTKPLEIIYSVFYITAKKIDIALPLVFVLPNKGRKTETSQKPEIYSVKFFSIPQSQAGKGSVSFKETFIL
jgi:hypothetical protein